MSDLRSEWNVKELPDLEERMSNLGYYYDMERSKYLLPEDRRWIPITETALRRHLRESGFCPKRREGERVSEVDAALNYVQLKKYVAYAGPLAGYDSGEYEFEGERVLVTDGPSLIDPEDRPWKTVQSIVEQLLGEQTVYFYGWLKIAIESLRAKLHRCGQALVIAGMRDCGKSFVQTQIITPMLGGRDALPYQYMTGATAFNKDLFRGEHQRVEDEFPSTDLRSRRKFGAAIKGIAANEIQRCHGKHRDGIVLAPFWRLSITLNDEPENLMVLPPVDESLADKLILLRADQVVMPMAANTNEERKALRDAIAEELPGFVHFLLNWVIPEDKRSPRYGITHWHHPDLLEAIDDLAPETRLLALIDRTLFTGKDPRPWRDKALVLEQKLTDSDSGVCHEARQLLKFNTALGTYLGRLAKRADSRVKKEPRAASGNVWVICPPRGDVFDV
jgi:hypothetical protein